MKRILFLILLFVSTAAMSQTINNQRIRWTQPFWVGGNDTSLYKTAADTNVLIFNRADSSWYYRSKSTYVKVGAGSGGVVDSLLFSTRAWRQKGDDSVAALISTRIADTLANARRIKAAGSDGVEFKANSGAKAFSYGQGGGSQVVFYGLPQYDINRNGSLSSLSFTPKGYVDSVAALLLRKADTATMLSPYARTAIVNANLATKLNISDTANMLSPYVRNSRTITINGTTQDLSANRTFNVGTVTSVGLSSATSGVTIGSTPVTGSGTITLAIATASGSQQGLLSSTDWTTFNNKQNALTNPVTGTGAAGQVSFWDGTNTQTGDNGLFWDNTNKRLGVGTTTPASTVSVVPAANTTGLTLSGYSLTGANAQPAVDISGTWNTTGAPTLIRANVTNTASNANSLLMDLQVGGSSIVRVFPNGSIQNSGNSAVGAIWGRSQFVVFQGRSLSLGGSTSGGTGDWFLNDGALSATAPQTSNYHFNRLANTFTQSGAGSGQVNILSILPTINQPSGTNITRGLFVNPTLTSAADWRSIEWSNNTGWGLFGSGTASNWLRGRTIIGGATAVDNGTDALQVSGRGRFSDSSAAVTISSSSDLWYSVARGSGFLNMGLAGNDAFFNSNRTYKFLSQNVEIAQSLQVNGSGSVSGGVNMATTSGNVGIGTTSPTARLHVVGTSLVTGDATFSDTVTAAAFFESSDIRLKNVVSTLTSNDGIDAINYTLKSNGSMKWGYSAQQVKQVLPFAVSEGSDGFLKVDYTTVHSFKIAMLEKRIEELEKLIKK